MTNENEQIFNEIVETHALTGDGVEAVRRVIESGENPNVAVDFEDLKLSNRDIKAVCETIRACTGNAPPIYWVQDLKREQLGIAK
jgi:hypothetical protein